MQSKQIEVGGTPVTIIAVAVGSHNYTYFSAMAYTYSIPDQSAVYFLTQFFAKLGR